jgi:hypothetical protein
MSAIGELVVWIIYAILCIPPLRALFILRKNKFNKNGAIYLVVASIPLALFAYSQYSNHRKAELEYVGIYYLTEYPNCDSCVLHLNRDNSYSVTLNGNELEHGNWKYRSGGDYWIVDIGEHGQLGTEKYTYHDRDNNFEK